MPTAHLRCGATPARQPLAPRARTWVAAASLLFATAPLLAAGGHHALDDAVILEPGACQLESWLTHADAQKPLLHAGSSCRVGPFQLGAATEHQTVDGSSQSQYQLQGKWATEVLPGFNAGVSLAGGWQAHVHPRYQVTTLAGLFSWFAGEDLAFHLNVRRDFLRGQADEDRSGVSLDWAAVPGWWLTAERYHEARAQFVRAGVRWSVTDAWSIDLSRAHRLQGPGASNWTFGTTWQFPGP